MMVTLTDSAYADLLRIGRDIKNNNPLRAESFVAELYDRCSRLGHMPRAYPLLPNREEKGIRRRPFRDYLIFYRIEGDTVQALHVLHGAMDYERILFPDE
jgi:toxin ParE1/3/4